MRGLRWKLYSRAFCSLGSRRAAQHWSTNGGALIRFCVLDFTIDIYFRRRLCWSDGLQNGGGLIRGSGVRANGGLCPPLAVIGKWSTPPRARLGCMRFVSRETSNVDPTPSPGGGPDTERPALENQEDGRKTLRRSPTPRESRRILQRHFSTLPCHAKPRIPLHLTIPARRPVRRVLHVRTGQLEALRSHVHL